MDTRKDFPKLLIRDGSNGLAIAAVPGESFDCVQFTLEADRPQDILIAPWIQFQPVNQAEWRNIWAYEIARRAKIYDSLVKRITELESINKDLKDRTTQKTTGGG